MQTPHLGRRWGPRPEEQSPAGCGRFGSEQNGEVSKEYLGMSLGYWCVNFWILGMRWIWCIFWDLYDLYGSLWIFPVSPSSSASKNHGGMSLGPSPGCPAQTKGAPKMLGSWGRKKQQGWNSAGLVSGLESDWKVLKIGIWLEWLEFFLALLSIALKRV